MKHAIFIIACALLHLTPVICIAVLATIHTELTTAVTVAILFFSTLWLGYWHGHQRTWTTPMDAPTTKASRSQVTRKIPKI